MSQVFIFATGGTFDKDYNTKTEGTKFLEQSHLREVQKDVEAGIFVET